jgi:hypothetical protein
MTGSTLLAEFKVGRRPLLEQGHEAAAKKLVDIVTPAAAEIAGLRKQLGSLHEGRPADLVVFERRERDPWLNVVEADPSWIAPRMIDGDLSYGRADRMAKLAASEDRERPEPLIAWGKPMLLDTRSTAGRAGNPPPTPAKLRADLIERYPLVVSIFA